MSSHSFATLTKALGLGKSRKQSRPPTLRTSLSHSSLFSPSTDDLSGSPRSAPPPTRSSVLRHSKSTSNFLTLGRSWTRKHRSQIPDHHIFSVPTTPSPKGPSKFTLERRSTSSTVSSGHTASTHYNYTTRAANESLPHSSLPAQFWPRFVWDPSAVTEEDIDLQLDDEDDYDNRPVFAEFFQRLREIEAELDLIEARDGVQN